tara:strand:+ start:180 stop:1100 length:921 start_codon:yes stop_codon:yes gene_type:complete
MVDKTIQEQIIREAPEIEAIKLGLLGSAKDLADIPIQLPEQQIAEFSPLQQAAFAGAAQPGGIGGFQPLLAQGTQTLGTGLSSLAGSAGLFQPTDLSAFTNPFQQQVIDTTLAELDRQGQIERNRLGAQAVAGGAFGGSRFGVENAELTGRLQDARARALAQLNQQNFQQALQTGQSSFENQQRRLQQLGQLQAGIGGQQLGAAQLSQAGGLRDIEAQQKLGLQQQQLQQAGLDAQRQNQQRQLFEPFSRVAFLSDIFKGAPSTQQTLGSQVAPAAQTPSAFQQVAGFGTGLLGTAAAAKSLGGLF